LLGEEIIKKVFYHILFTFRRKSSTRKRKAKKLFCWLANISERQRSKILRQDSAQKNPDFAQKVPSDIQVRTLELSRVFDFFDPREDETPKDLKNLMVSDNHF